MLRGSILSLPYFGPPASTSPPPIFRTTCFHKLSNLPSSRLSAEAQLNGAFDFNRTPIALPGTSLLIHEKKRLHAATGHPTPSVTGTSALPLNPLAATKFMSGRLPPNALSTHSLGSHQSGQPQTSSTNAANTAARELIQALKTSSPASSLSPIGP